MLKTILMYLYNQLVHFLQRCPRQYIIFTIIILTYIIDLLKLVLDKKYILRNGLLAKVTLFEG